MKHKIYNMCIQWLFKFLLQKDLATVKEWNPKKRTKEKNKTPKKDKGKFAIREFVKADKWSLHTRHFIISDSWSHI